MQVVHRHFLLPCHQDTEIEKCSMIYNMKIMVTNFTPFKPSNETSHMDHRKHSSNATSGNRILSVTCRPTNGNEK